MPEHDPSLGEAQRGRIDDVRGTVEPAVGFLLLAPVLLFVWFRTLGVRTPLAVAVAIVATLLIWYAFYKLLRVPLPWGVLTRFAF